jgi:hypothetical protein
VIRGSDLRRWEAGWWAAALLSCLPAAPAGAECPIKFRDVTAQTGIDFVHTHGGSDRKYIVETVTAGLALFDYDNDGYPDIFVANDVSPNSLFHNDRRGKFKDVALLAGVACDINGQANANMGVDCADYNNSGLLSFYVTNYQDQLALLFKNIGHGTFEDVTLPSGAGSGTLPYVAWGCGFVDLDNDGRMDVVILNSNDKPTILRNESVTGNHWIQVRLRGVKTNRDGVGARVYVVAGDLKQMDEVHSGRGYQSHWGTRLHFGLAKNKRVERIEVHWPRSGVVDILEDVPADQLLVIVEGSAPSKLKPLFVYPRLPVLPARK